MNREPQKLADTAFDLVVIGGGIHGACIARSAAERGLSVALVERDDFGAHTSHNSLKIVHGGLRYLQHADFRRTRESVVARSRWLREAPHLVRPLGFLMPLTGWLARGPAALRAAMWVHQAIGWDRNDGLAADRRLPGGRILSAAETRDLLPDLPEDKLSGGALWHDGHMLDADRLLMASLEAATRHGAVACNYMSAQKITLKSGKVAGVDARDELTGDRCHIQSKSVINAAGPWTSPVASLVEASGAKLHMGHSKNMNLIVPQIAPDVAFGVKSKRRSDSLLDSSNRLFFITPWRGMSVIGTTHEPYSGEPDEFSPSDRDIEQFVEEINAAYPVNLGPDDIRYCYAGLTPAGEGLRHGEAKRARHGALVDHGDEDGIHGLFSLIGVKYTTAQLVADRAVSTVANAMNKPIAKHSTGLLPGADGYTSEKAMVAALSKRITRPEDDPEVVQFATTFGAEAFAALETGGWSADDGNEALYKCRVRFAVRAESACRLQDIALRRTERLPRGQLHKADLDWAAEFMAAELGWSSQRQTSEMESCLAVIRRQRGRLAEPASPGSGPRMPQDAALER